MKQRLKRAYETALSRTVPVREPGPVKVLDINFALGDSRYLQSVRRRGRLATEIDDCTTCCNNLTALGRSSSIYGRYMQFVLERKLRRFEELNARCRYLMKTHHHELVTAVYVTFETEEGLLRCLRDYEDNAGNRRKLKRGLRFTPKVSGARGADRVEARAEAGGAVGDRGEGRVEVEDPSAVEAEADDAWARASDEEPARDFPREELLLVKQAEVKFVFLLIMCELQCETTLGVSLCPADLGVRFVKVLLFVTILSFRLLRISFGNTTARNHWLKPFAERVCGCSSSWRLVSPISSWKM